MAFGITSRSVQNVEVALLMTKHAPQHGVSVVCLDAIRNRVIYRWTLRRVRCTLHLRVQSTSISMTASPTCPSSPRPTWHTADRLPITGDTPDDLYVSEMMLVDLCQPWMDEWIEINWESQGGKLIYVFPEKK